MANITVINIITVDDGWQDAAAVLQLETVQKIKSKARGFISQKTLKSFDGLKVATIEEWASEADVRAVAASPQLAEYRQRLEAHGKIAPSLYAVVGDSQN